MNLSDSAARGNSKRILVTGGAAYIGSHMVKLLNSLGYLPVVVDNLSNGDRELVEAAAGRKEAAYIHGTDYAKPDGTCVREVIQAVEKVTGNNIPKLETHRRSGHLARLVGTSQEAAQSLGWKPNYPSLEGMVESSWKWHGSLFWEPRSS